MLKPNFTFHDDTKHYYNSDIYFSQVTACGIDTLAPSGGHFDGLPQSAQRAYYLGDEMAQINSIRSIYVKQMTVFWWTLL